MPTARFRPGGLNTWCGCMMGTKRVSPGCSTARYQDTLQMSGKSDMLKFVTFIGDRLGWSTQSSRRSLFASVGSAIIHCREFVFMEKSCYSLLLLVIMPIFTIYFGLSTI